MSFRIRTLMRPRSILLRPAIVTPHKPTPQSIHNRNFTPAPAISGYGDPEQTGQDPANPKVNDPLNETTRREHPGREPVAEGQKGKKTESGSEQHHPHPTINVGKEASGEGNPEVEKHNREFRKGFEHGEKGKDQAVEKDYWSGE